jgi:hypothetical protein
VVRLRAHAITDRLKRGIYRRNIRIRNHFQQDVDRRFGDQTGDRGASDMGDPCDLIPSERGCNAVRFRDIPVGPARIVRRDYDRKQRPQLFMVISPSDFVIYFSLPCFRCFLR